MNDILVRGGERLSGEVRIAGAKNAALKMMAASLLTDEEVILTNVPRISGITVMSELLRALGVSVEWCNDHTLRIHAASVQPVRFDIEVFSRERASFVLLAPLLARCGEATLPNPGGDRIGHRPVDRLVEGVRKFGARLEYDGEYYIATCNHLKGAEYTFRKNSHMGTESQILAAVMASGQSVIQNAAEEPEVDDLISMLNAMGGKVRRVKPRTIVVDGVGKLRGVQHKVMPDRIEAGTFATIAAATDGDLYLQNTDPHHMVALLDKFTHSGCIVDKEPDAVRVRRGPELKPVHVRTSPHPGFMTDWQAPFVVYLTQVPGISTVHETIFPNRFGYTGQLNSMGANIELFNPPIPDHGYEWNDRDDSSDYFHAARIYGDTRISAARLEIEDLRAGATLIIAALCADGTSEISGMHWVERGYEDFVGRLRSVGANIEIAQPAAATA